MENENQQYYHDENVPMCKRRKKRKCVLDYEIIKNTLEFDHDYPTPPPLEKISPRVAGSGKRRGRPPTKKCAYNYVFSTDMINMFATINDLENKIDLIDFHRRFLSKNPIMTPELVSQLMLQMSNFKQNLLKPAEPIKVTKPMPHLNARKANTSTTWQQNHVPQVSQPYHYNQPYYQPIPSLHQPSYPNNYQNYSISYPHTTGSAPVINYPRSTPTGNEFYYNLGPNAQCMPINSTQRGPVLPHNVFNANQQYWTGKYNERTDR